MMSNNTIEITSEAEEGFADLVFCIEDHQVLSDGSQTLRATGLYRGHPVGFDLVLGGSWKQRAKDQEFPVVWSRGVVFYRTLGAQSDLLLQILDELYQTGLRPVSMNSDTQFTGISLSGDPVHLDCGVTKIKLFYELGGEEGYAELYTNIDLSAGIVEVREKDTGYREQIIRALTAP